MFRVLAVLCFLAAPALGPSKGNVHDTRVPTARKETIRPVGSGWQKGLRVRFGINPFAYGSSIFMKLPQTITDAVAKGWQEITDGRTADSGYENLSLYCPKNDYTFCQRFDKKGVVAGIQVCLDTTNSFTDGLWEWEVSGFEPWFVTDNGIVTEFYCSDVYLVSTDIADNPEQRNITKIVEDKFYLKGFKSDLITVPTATEELKQTKFTKQGCIPFMGNHYFYNMTKSLPCTTEKMLHWFVIEKDGEVIGFSIMVPGKYNTLKGKTDYFERPAELAIKIAIPTVPDCLANIASNPGVLLMHVYFIDTPYEVLCF